MIEAMRRTATWLLTLPLAAGGSQLAHAEAYRIVYADPHERSHALATSGHAYLEHAPFALAVGIALVLAALVSHARARRGTRLAAWPFAVFPIAVFVLQEVLERGGQASALVEATTLVGLALQLPFAALAYAVARLLLHAVDVLTREQPRVPQRSRRAVVLLRPTQLHTAPLPRLAFGVAQRGPPRRR